MTRIKKTLFVTRDGIRPQDTLWLFVERKIFPREDLYSILKGFGEITIETPQSPTSEEFFSLKATTEQMEGMGAEGHDIDAGRCGLKAATRPLVER